MATIYTATDIGPTRQTNEDSLAIIAPDTYVVADGMGGYAAGEVASRLLVKTAQEMLQNDTPITEEELKKVIFRANRQIIDAAKEKPEYQGMGTTATLCHILDNKAADTTVYWAHVGDSRLYHWQAGKITQITRDHSYVAYLVDKGKIAPEDMPNHPNRNMLTRAVGIDAILSVDGGSFPIAAGDMLLLATDGLTGKVSDEEISQILADESIIDKADALVKTALENGTRDNVTVIVIKHDDQETSD